MEHRLRMGVATRLSRYLDVACQAAMGERRLISSHQISLYTGINPTQVRRDLSSFGKFGRRGFGYEIEVLRRELENMLSAREIRPIVVVGVGRVGEALVSSGLLRRHGLEIVAIFDSDPEKIGRRVGALSVSPVSELRLRARELGVVGAVVAVPAASAQNVADELVDAGVSVIFNYSAALLDVPKGVSIQTTNPAVALISMFSGQAG